MGLMNIFSKKNNKVSNVQEEQVVEDYYAPVEEPVGELPVGRFVSDDAINNTPDIKFDDEAPMQVLTAEQKQLVDNGYFLNQSTIEQVNPTVSLFQSVQPVEQNNNIEDNSYLDDELPDNNDGGFINSNVDGTYSSVSSQSYEDDRVNEHRFFAQSYEEEVVEEKPKGPNIYGNYDIFNIGRIDQPTSNNNEYNQNTNNDSNIYTNEDEQAKIKTYNDDRKAA